MLAALAAYYLSLLSEGKPREDTKQVRLAHPTSPSSQVLSLGGAVIKSWHPSAEGGLMEEPPGKGIRK